MAIRNALPFEFPYRWNEIRRFFSGMPDEAADFLDQRDRDLEDFLATLGAATDDDASPGVATGWTNVTPLGTQASPDHAGWGGKPSDWSDSSAKWIWHGSGNRTAGEQAWFVGTYSAASSTAVTIEVAADNGATVWLNGTLLGSLGVTSGTSTVGFDTRTTFAATLQGGLNQIAVLGTNAGSSASAAGVLLSVAETSSGTVLFRSTDGGGWHVWTSEPAGWPTPGLFIVLDDLGDVDLSSTPPTNGQALVYNSASGLWLPGTVAGGGGGADFAEIAHVDVSVATSTIAFTGIPTGYRDLKVRGRLRTSAAANGDGVAAVFGDASYDTGATSYVYSVADFDASGGAFPLQSSGTTQLVVSRLGVQAASSVSDRFSPFEMDVLSYTDTGTGKTVTTKTSAYWGTGAGHRLNDGWGYWTSTSVVERIRFTSVAGANFAAGSRLTLYGVGSP